MHYIVGLGNPGKEYAQTRHNVGFLFVEHFVKEAGLPDLHESKTYNGSMSEGVFEGNEVTAFLPHTYMNASGGAVAKLVPRSDAERLIVIYDEVDLPLGLMKVSFGRGDGGHNGVKSIIAALGTRDFIRVRVGIGGKSMWTGKPVRPKGDALASYVLKKFSPKELIQLQELMGEVPEMISLFLLKGKEAVMNTYN
jgi:peptidyl-tRNA hydrolase, PTH1 family